MELTWTLTNTAVQYVEPWIVTKVQATGWTWYIVTIWIFVIIWIFMLKALFWSKKDRGESDEEYLTRTRDAARRSRQIQEENQVMTKENPQWESMKDHLAK